MRNSKKGDKYRIMQYLSPITEESTLNVWHLAILTAILYLGCQQGKRRKIRVSRKNIMAVSHISTFPTYHKYFKELQDLGYFRYIPSYHPGVRSEVVLNKKRLSKI
ncbi:hypothetical protein ACFSJW_07445 [Flavobacterium artemisiae]|uniref:Uncharacterized protein n=1 Tax=Flavobacterium artemisiae TaxID=2126556 RepID=A0ABW4HCE3_9FLAO